MIGGWTVTVHSILCAERLAVDAAVGENSVVGSAVIQHLDRWDCLFGYYFGVKSSVP